MYMYMLSTPTSANFRKLLAFGGKRHGLHTNVTRRLLHFVGFDASSLDSFVELVVIMLTHILGVGGSRKASPFSAIVMMRTPSGEC